MPALAAACAGMTVLVLFKRDFGAGEAWAARPGYESAEKSDVPSPPF